MKRDILEQLAQLVLPKEILKYFEIVKIETEESDIDAMSMTIYMDERMNSLLQESEEYESKGFLEAVSITDFPIRDHKVILVLRRRRWKNVHTGESFVEHIRIRHPLLEGVCGFFKRDVWRYTRRPAVRLSNITM